MASGNVDTKIRSPQSTIMEISAGRRYVGGCGDGARVHFYSLLDDRAATVRKQKGIQDEVCVCVCVCGWVGGWVGGWVRACVRECVCV